MKTDALPSIASCVVMVRTGSHHAACKEENSKSSWNTTRHPIRELNSGLTIVGAGIAGRKIRRRWLRPRATSVAARTQPHDFG